jgi:pimeloyl-ACP methyl ester carboxylesterase
MSKAINLNLLNVVKRQAQNMLKTPLQCEAVPLASQSIFGKKDRNVDKPIVFLHGLFGSSSTFKSYAQNSQI